MISRRAFLKTGVTGGVLLHLAACARPAAGGGRAAVVTALVPAVLAGALPTDPEQRQSAIARTVTGVDKAIDGLSLAAQEEVAQLFDLLAFPPTRIIVAGVHPPWPQASVEEITGFLESWRQSRFDLLRTGYAGLHDLILGSWYAQDGAWSAIGYPGPPRVK